MDFSKLTAYIDSLSSVGVPGCDLAVYHDHEMIYRHRAGHRDEAGREDVRDDDVYCLYSCTKVFTTCAAMQLIGEGKLGLEDPVSRYLPAYAHMQVRGADGSLHPAKGPITIRHLMSMQSGMDYDLGSPAIKEALETCGQKATTRQLVDAKAKDPLCFEPGADYLYSLSHDVLAVVIEEISGLRFSEYLKKNIFEPLKLPTVGFALTKDIRSRLCAQYSFDDATKQLVTLGRDEDSFRLAPDYESGGAGLYSDVADYAVFVDALACGGVGADGRRILSEEMIQLWSANQLGPVARRTFDTWNRKGYSYALGVRTRVSTALGGPGQIGEFGWDGAAGAWTMIDPVNHLSAFYAMHVRNFGYVYDVIHPTIRGLIYEGWRG